MVKSAFTISIIHPIRSVSSGFTFGPMHTKTIKRHSAISCSRMAKRFLFSKESDRGYINSLNFSVNGIPATQEDHPQHQDIVRLLLPDPLLPGRDVKISTAFHVQLPKNISRGGHIGQSYQITQWYPKPAVYDRLGWHPIPYLDQESFMPILANTMSASPYPPVTSLRQQGF